MLNEEMRTLTLNRSTMCRINTALTSVIVGFMDEIANPETTEDRRKVCESSLEMWKAIRAESRRQLDEQDALSE